MKAIVSILIALLVIPFVLADFSVVLTPYEQQVCPSDHVSYDLTVKNEGHTKDLFGVTVSDEVKNWTTVLPNNFALEAGQSQKVNIFVQPYYTAQPSSIDFIITTSSAKITPLKAKLDIQSCRGVNLNALPVSACQGSVLSAFVNIQNTGKVNDTYNITSDQKWVTPENNTVTLQGNASSQIKLKFGAVPLGSNNVKITAQSLSSYAKSTITLPVNFEKCFDNNVKPVAPLELCPGQNGTIDIIIQNSGTKPDVYSVYTKDAFVEFENKTLYLGPNENHTVTAKVVIPKTVRSDQNFTLNVEGNAKQSYKQLVKVTSYDKCYSFTTAVDKRDISVKQSENTYTTLAIKNNGKFPLDLNIKSDLSWVDAGSNSLSINSNDSKQLFVYVAPTYDVKDGNYTANIVVSSQDLNKTEKLNIFVNRPIQKSEEPKKVETNKTTESNETAPVIDTSKIAKPVNKFFRFVFSPILDLLAKL